MSSAEDSGDVPAPSGVPSQVDTERSGVRPGNPGSLDLGESVQHFARELTIREDQTLNTIMQLLSGITQNRQRNECDSAFLPLWSSVIQPYAEVGLGHRAALFARCKLVPTVLSSETECSIKFHKGGLFYNTAIAHLFIDDHDRFEYFLAMADDEDCRTSIVEGKAHDRGAHSLKQGELSHQTIQSSLQFGCKLLNEKVNQSPLNYEFVFGSPITVERYDIWRSKLDGLHHAEWFRILRDAELFRGDGMPVYPQVRDNPYVLLRLVKVLGHAAQWCESRLTQLQSTLRSGTISGNSLSPKLKNDPVFSALVTAAGGKDHFPGKNLHGAAVDKELNALLTAIYSQQTENEKMWRLLRVLYIVRNSTAHQIDGSLAFHANRDYLVKLIQAVMLAYFAIERLKNGTAC
jgi:hypothetical protein